MSHIPCQILWQQVFQRSLPHIPLVLCELLYFLVEESNCYRSRNLITKIINLARALHTSINTSTTSTWWKPLQWFNNTGCAIFIRCSKTQIVVWSQVKAPTFLRGPSAQETLNQSKPQNTKDSEDKNKQKKKIIEENRLNKRISPYNPTYFSVLLLSLE